MNKKWNRYPSLNRTKKRHKLKWSNEYSSTQDTLKKSRNELEYLKLEKEKDRHTCSI